MILFQNFTLDKITRNMSQISKIKINSTKIIAFAYIFLFVYTAVSKIIDFENFEIQLGQSPLLSSFAGWVAIAVPASEIIIAIGLMVNRFRFVALLASYTLMTMFTAYIYIILNYSEFIPCSCGGILEKMDWKQHLAFNIIFMLFAATSIFCINDYTVKIKSAALMTGTIMGAGIVVLLFVLSEEKMKYDNGFIRRFPQHSAQEINQAELTYNSYYFAGTNNGKIYLGNHTAPLLMTILDTALKSQRTIKIELIEKHLPFQRPTIRVFENNFYVFEGAIPYIYKGNISNWKASLRMYSGTKFSQFEPIDSTTIALRYDNPKTAENLIGILDLSDTTLVRYNPILLQKQIDGIFDTDGKLNVDNLSNQLIYLYLYRNQYTIANENLRFVARGKTIDTISQASLKISKIKSRGVNTLSKPPLIVNRTSAVSDGYLYANSAMRGRYESDYLWKHTTSIDVYRIEDQSYQYSLSIDNIGRKKMKAFIVRKNRLYALVDTKIIAYKLVDYKSIKIKELIKQ